MEINKFRDLIEAKLAKKDRNLVFLQTTIKDLPLDDYLRSRMREGLGDDWDENSYYKQLISLVVTTFTNNKEQEIPLYNYYDTDHGSVFSGLSIALTPRDAYGADSTPDFKAAVDELFSNIQLDKVDDFVNEFNATFGKSGYAQAQVINNCLAISSKIIPMELEKLTTSNFKKNIKPIVDSLMAFYKIIEDYGELIFDILKYKINLDYIKLFGLMLDEE